MPIPNAEHALIPNGKLRDYLLNPAHPVGGSKARWFSSVGYDVESSEQLSAELLQIVRKSDDYLEEKTDFGVKYLVKGKIELPAGGYANLVTVWIIEFGHPDPRLVTAFPDEKDYE